MRVFCLKTEEETLFITTPRPPTHTHTPLLAVPGAQRLIFHLTVSLLTATHFVSLHFFCSPWPRKLHKEEEKRKKNTRRLNVQSHLGLIEDSHIWQIKPPKLDRAEAKRGEASQESGGGAVKRKECVVAGLAVQSVLRHASFTQRETAAFFYDKP